MIYNRFSIPGKPEAKNWSFHHEDAKDTKFSGESVLRSLFGRLTRASTSR